MTSWSPAFIQLNRQRVFWAAFILSIGLMSILNWVGAPMKTPAAPCGIISFEFARTSEKATAMLDSWDSDASLRAAFTLGLDYLFMPAYAAAIALACLWAGEVFRSRAMPQSALGTSLVIGQVIAALSDAVENIALISILLGNSATAWPQVAFFCAALKFGLILLGLMYVFWGLAIRYVIKK